MFSSDTDPTFGAYLVRDFPEISRACNIVPNEQLWAVGGQVINGDEHIAKRMSKDARFSHVSFHKY